VRGISVGEFSRELCGGTHVRNSGAIGQFKIISESSAAAGVRRIEALTGGNALAWRRSQEERLERIAGRLKVPPERVEERVAALAEEVRELKGALRQARSAGAGDHFADLLQARREVGGCPVYYWESRELGHDELAALVDRLRSREEDFLLLAASVGGGGKVALVGAAGGKPLAGKGDAGDLVKRAATLLGGGGGGRPHFAKGQGRSAEGLDRVREDFFSAAAKICGGKKG
jgi:alanyl-tRNA synthetase